jgi:hypothetical protein
MYKAEVPDDSVQNCSQPKLPHQDCLISRPLSRLALCHTFQRKLVDDHQTGTLRLDELLFLEVGKQAADGLARCADHLCDFRMRQGQMQM